jgi:hypothetical protein
MAYLLTCNIEIGKYKFPFAHEVSIERAWDTLGDKCTIKMPTNAVLKDVGTNVVQKLSFDEVLKTGTKVLVQLGYDGNNATEFVGYIAEIVPTYPLEIVCEDEIYNYKRSAIISKNYANISLKNLLKEHFADATLSDSIPDVSLVNFVLNRVTKAEILQKLKDEYLLCAYFRKGKLFIGLPYTEKNPQTSTFRFQGDMVENKLRFRKKEDMKLLVKMVSIDANGAKVEAEVGDKNGEIITIHKRNIKSKEALETIGKVELEKYKFEGYQGSFTSFIIPYIDHSDTCELLDEIYPERKGKYLVDKVKVTWGVGGARREVNLGRKLIQ